MAPKYGQSGKGEQSKAKTFLVDDGPHGDAGLRHGVCHGGQLLLREVGKPGVCLQRLQMPSHVACVTRERWDGHQGGGRALKYSGMSPRAPTEGLLLGIITPMISTGPYPPKKNVNLCLSKQELLSNIGSNCLTDAAREPTTGCSVGRGEGGTPSTG